MTERARAFSGRKDGYSRLGGAGFGGGGCLGDEAASQRYTIYMMVKLHSSLAYYILKGVGFPHPLLTKDNT